MRIAIIRQQYTPYGGAERFVSNALSALNASSSDTVETTLICRRWQALGDTPEHFHTIRCDPSYFPKTSVRRDESFAEGVKEILKTHHFDLSQTHERIPGCDIFRAGDGVHATWLSIRNRIASPLKRFGMMLNPYHRYMLETEKELLTAPTLKAVICNSKMVRDDIQNRFNVPSEKLHIIYNGYDNAQFSPELVADFRDMMRRQLPLQPDTTVFLFVGSGFERKGLTQAINAIKDHPKAILVVVGYDKKFEWYRKMAQSVCPGRVIFVGPTTDVRPYYGAADVLLLPTLYDPFPNVVFEAMSCKLPVITTLQCGGQDMIANGVEGFICDCLDVPALSEAVNQLCNAEFRHKAAEAAYQRIAPYTMDKMAKQLSELYSTLLNAKKT